MHRHEHKDEKTQQHSILEAYDQRQFSSLDRAPRARNSARQNIGGKCLVAPTVRGKLVGQAIAYALQYGKRHRTVQGGWEYRLSEAVKRLNHIQPISKELGELPRIRVYCDPHGAPLYFQFPRSK